MQTFEAIVQATVMVGGVSALTLIAAFWKPIWAALKQGWKDAIATHNEFNDWRDM